MKPDLFITNVKHIVLPDNFFLDYSNVKQQVLAELENIPKKSLVLSSASSLTNIVGHQITLTRPDITFLDIGTSLHSKMGLDENIRSYHVTAIPWNIGNFAPKLKYRLSSSYKLKW